MHIMKWRKLMLSLLILAILAGSAGCQVTSGAAESMQRFKDEVSDLPHRVGQALSNLFSSIGSVGTALVESIKSTVGGLIGR